MKRKFNLDELLAALAAEQAKTRRIIAVYDRLIAESNTLLASCRRYEP